MTYTTPLRSSDYLTDCQYPPSTTSNCHTSCSCLCLCTEFASSRSSETRTDHGPVLSSPHYRDVVVHVVQDSFNSDSLFSCSFAGTMWDIKKILKNKSRWQWQCEVPNPAKCDSNKSVVLLTISLKLWPFQSIGNREETRFPQSDCITWGALSMDIILQSKDIISEGLSTNLIE